jgi:hypothetical protein
MSGPTSKSAWTKFERDIARTDWASERMPLSGENSRHGGGDVIIPKYLDVLIECKYRATQKHHTLYKDAIADAAKHGKKHGILYTKVKGDHGWCVVVGGELFSQIIKLPEVQELLRVRNPIS